MMRAGVALGAVVMGLGVPLARVNDKRAEAAEPKSTPRWCGAKSKKQVGQNELDVVEPTLIAVRLDNPPTTRVRLSFDAETGTHEELEWDPAIDGRLAQQLLLPVGTWHVSPTVEVVTAQNGSFSMLAVRFDELAGGNNMFTLKGVYAALTPASVATDKAFKPTAFPDPTLTIKCRAELPTMDSVHFAKSLGGPSGQRGFNGPIPEPVTEVLSLLREIAIERAKAGTLALLKHHLVEPLCGSEQAVGVTLDDLGLLTKDPALPRSCALLDQMRLDDVLASGKPLLRALRDDLRFTIIPALVDRVGGDSAWATVIRQALAIVNRAIDHESFSILEAEAALDLFNDLRGLVSVTDLAIVNLDLAKSRLAPVITDASTALCPGEPAMACVARVMNDARSIETLIALVDKVPPAIRDRFVLAFVPDDLKAIVTLVLDGLQHKVFASIAACAKLADSTTCAEALLGKLTSEEVRIALLYVADAQRRVFLDAVAAHDPAAELATYLTPALEQITSSVAPECKEREPYSCVLHLITDVRSPLDLYQLAVRVISSNRDKFVMAVTSWFEAEMNRSGPLSDGVAIACQARLAVAVVRSCTGSTCAPARIGEMLEYPERYFRRDDALPASLCWEPSANRAIYRKVPKRAAAFRDIVVEGLELLDATTSQQGVARAVSVLRLFIALSREAANCAKPGGASGRGCQLLDEVGTLLTSLAQGDYVATLGSAARIARTYVKLPVGFSKGAQLIGAVASYANIFNETKDLDSKAAHDARKQALESMIDSATDRHGRDHDWVSSLGSNVGLSGTWTWNRNSNGSFVGDGSWAPQVRVPIGISFQKLPPTGPFDAGYGIHLGVVIGDLGQFAAVGKKGAVDDVRWSNFLSPGIEFGFILGSKPDSALNMAVHVEYAPTLFQITSGDSMTGSISGAVRFGISVGYYVPFFDFN